MMRRRKTGELTIVGSVRCHDSGIGGRSVIEGMCTIQRAKFKEDGRKNCIIRYEKQRCEGNCMMGRVREVTKETRWNSGGGRGRKKIDEWIVIRK